MPYPFIPCLFSAVFPAFAAGFEAPAAGGNMNASAKTSESVSRCQMGTSGRSYSHKPGRRPALTHFCRNHALYSRKKAAAQALIGAPAAGPAGRPFA